MDLRENPKTKAILCLKLLDNPEKSPIIHGKNLKDDNFLDDFGKLSSLDIYDGDENKGDIESYLYLGRDKYYLFIESEGPVAILSHSQAIDRINCTDKISVLVLSNKSSPQNGIKVYDERQNGYYKKKKFNSEPAKQDVEISESGTSEDFYV